MELIRNINKLEQDFGFKVHGMFDNCKVTLLFDTNDKSLLHRIRDQSEKYFLGLKFEFLQSFGNGVILRSK